MLKNLNHKKLFLLDGLGATLTALLLSQVLGRYESLFGMPREILFTLAGIACSFAVYSLLCYLFLNQNWQPFLKGIAIANTSYCVITLCLLVYQNDSLTFWGFAYFSGEIIVILILARAEFKSAKKMANSI